MSAVLEALIGIQRELKSPKDQRADKYRYRNIEDINQAVKPLAAERGCAVVYTDRFEGGICVSTCTLVGEDGEMSANGFSCVDMYPKFMSVEQACGAASSFARKYAACGLFAIDNSENDPDRVQAGKPRASEAKKRAWNAMNRYAELHGAEPNAVAEGTKKRPDFEDTDRFWNMVAEEFEDACA